MPVHSCFADVPNRTSGITTFILGITAITWKKELSVLVFTSTFIGLLILWFLIGEITVPH